MSEIEALEKIGTDAVKRLRKQKLSSGKPFMINSDALKAGQSYLEFPDNSIKLVSVSPNAHSFEIINVLTEEQAVSLRKMYNLL